MEKSKIRKFIISAAKSNTPTQAEFYRKAREHGINTYSSEFREEVYRLRRAGKIEFTSDYGVSVL